MCAWSCQLVGQREGRRFATTEGSVALSAMVGTLTSLLEAPSLPEGLARGVGAVSEGVEGVLGSDPDSPLLKRAFTSALAKRSRSAAPANKPAQHATL